MVPFPVPDGVTVHQVWSLVAVQLMFEVTSKVVVPDVDVTSRFEGNTLSVAAPLACVTVTILLLTPEPATVIVAILELVPGFAV